MIPVAKREKGKTLVLFDVDGTLTPARKEIDADMRETLAKLREKVVIGTVGGSDMAKQMEQLGTGVLTDFDYCFAENGLVAYKNGELIAKQSLSAHLGDDVLKRLINYLLGYMAKIDIPVKRGTFIEFRCVLPWIPRRLLPSSSSSLHALALSRSCVLTHPSARSQERDAERESGGEELQPGGAGRV